MQLCGVAKQFSGQRRGSYYRTLPNNMYINDLLVDLTASYGPKVRLIAGLGFQIQYLSS